MSPEWTVGLAAIFLLAIPLNLHVARDVRRFAQILPPIPMLSLLSSLVSVLATVATVLGILSFAAVVFLATGMRLIPVPGSTIALVVVLLIVSLANVLVWRYLRAMRRPAA